MPENLSLLAWNSMVDTLWPLFKASWWFWLLLFVIWLISEIGPDIMDKILRDRKFSGINNMHSDRDMLYKLRHYNPTEFEDYIAHLYADLGYRTERVGKSHDGGIDVIAEKDGIKHFIQCKKFITSKVHVGAVRDFYGAMLNELSNCKGIFITTNIFTTEAEQFAEANMIETIDGHELIKLVKLAGGANSLASLGVQNSEKCPKCGSELIKKRGKHGYSDFYACPNYPKCKYIKRA